MNVAKTMKTLCRGTVEGGYLFLLLGLSLALGGSTYAQTQAQPASADSSRTAAASEVPPAVAQELQEVKARVAQMESQLKDLAAFVTPATFAVRSPRPAPTKVTLAGTVSCGHCQGIQPIHKGYTQFTWALNSVSQGDDIVLVSQNQVYKLQGNKDETLKFMSSKARVTGLLDGNTLAVETISRAVKGE
jgi:CRISPR-associated Cas5-like protein